MQRQAAAADALAEAVAQALELSDPFVDTFAPLARQLDPVGSFRHAVPRQFGELGGDFGQRQANLLREHDEGDAPQHGARVAPVPGAGTLRGDEALGLVETEGGGGYAAAA